MRLHKIPPKASNDLSVAVANVLEVISTHGKKIEVKLIPSSLCSRLLLGRQIGYLS